MRSVFLIGIFVLLLFNNPVSGQYYETGQDPFRLKWMQIKTDRFTIIYPESFGNSGVEFAKSLTKSYSDITRNLYPARKFRLPVIIHNYTTQANGYVAWAPKRMELYPTPEQNSIPLDPLRQLTLHELTHVAQMDALNTGFSKGMSFLFGEQFPGAVAAMLPQWFMEGDAVFTESVLTASGRGRAPNFQRELKALTVEKGVPFKYDKLLNGSYKDHTPDPYQFGYQMVSWSLAKNGIDLWQKVIKTTASAPYSINPVNISLFRNARITKKGLFYQTFDSLRTLWTNDISASKAKDYSAFNQDKKNRYINYYSPLYVGKDSVIAIKTSLSSPPAFVLLSPSERKEKKIFTPGSLYPWFISYGKDRLVWVETRMDPRWENANYSVIRILDLKTGLVRQLTYSSRFLAASISKDARVIAASENTVENRNSLVLVDPVNGGIIESIPAPENAFLQHPQWSADDNKITVISLTKNGEGILAYDLKLKTWTKLMEEGAIDLQSTFLRNDSLFYISSVSGTDDAYLLTPDKMTFKITRTRFGATDLNLKGGQVIFCNYTSSGNELCETALKDAEIYDNSIQKSAYLAERFNLNGTQAINETDLQFVPEPYKKWQHLFGFHSWMPVYADIDAIQTDPASIRPGVTILSQNQLGSLISSFGYEYSSDHSHLFHSKITWKGWYPVVESRLDYNTPQVVSKMNENINWTPSDIKNGFKFNNSIYIPLNFSTGKFYHHIMPELSFNYVNKYVYLKEKGNYDYGQTQIINRLYLSNYSISSFRDIYPRWAQVIDLYFTSAPFDKLLYGTDLTLKTAFYFPGLLKNQSLRIRFESEKQDFAKFLTINRVDFPRGYSNLISEKLKFFSTEYSTPLFYPDLNISSVLYITRIRGNLFFDYATGINNYHLTNESGSLTVGTHNTGTEYFKSYGFELLSDFHLFRIPYPVSAGIQAGWKDAESAPTIKFLFSVDVYGMNIGAFRHSKAGY